MSSTAKRQQSGRLIGIDVARALAIGGMALVHFVMVLSANRIDDGALSWFYERLAGRPAMVFMLLAGIGISLRFRNVSNDSVAKTKKASLFRRGLFFLAVGFLNLMLWPGDILRVYGVAYIIASYLALSRDRTLFAWAFGVVGVFVAAIFTIDFGTNWDFATLEYANLWTIRGGLLNLFYNGFRATLPWLGVMFIGIWIGRCNLKSPKVRLAFFVAGLIAWMVAESISFGLLSVFKGSVSAAEMEDVVSIFGTDSLPPMPLFLCSSGGLGVALIMFCTDLSERLSAKVTCWLANAGQLAFTWYIAHIFVVIAAGIATGFRGDVSVANAWIVSGVFFVTMCLLSVWYRSFQKSGPLELLLRKVAG